MAEQQSTDDQQAKERLGSAGWRRRTAVVNLMEITIGQRISIADDAVGEVVDNPRDGSWIIVRYLESPADESKVGQEEPVFAEDVVGMVE